MAIDPGEKRIGLAISDLTGTIANPLTIINHKQRQEDAKIIVQIATENKVERLVIGQALDSDGQIGPQARKSQKLAEACKQQTMIPVELWDESGSTQAAKSARIEMGTKRAQRKGHLDALAAVIILQSFLDAQKQSPS